MADNKKKIIIDEDWKTQVEAERAAAAQGSPESAADEPGAAGGPAELPPAEFHTIVSMLATQVMLSLGALPNPINGQTQVHPPQAKHFIDLLAILQQKTEGNLTPEEGGMIEHLLHELRMAYLEVQNQPVAPPEEE